MEEENVKEFAAKVFYNFVTSKDKRLQYGIKERARMKDAIKKGEKVSGYRPEWIIETANAVISTLITSSERFNNTHFNDLVSVDDLVDVLNTASHKLTNMGKKKKS